MGLKRKVYAQSATEKATTLIVAFFVPKMPDALTSDTFRLVAIFVFLTCFSSS